MWQPQARHDGVERGIREGQCLGVAPTEPGPRVVLLGAPDHRLGDVDPGRKGSTLGRPRGEVARATSDVKHPGGRPDARGVE